MQSVGTSADVIQYAEHDTRCYNMSIKFGEHYTETRLHNYDCLALPAVCRLG